MTNWQQVEISGESPAAVGQPGVLPSSLRGLARETLADLSPLADSVPELSGVGWWPVTEVDEDLDDPRLVTEEARVEISRPLRGRQAQLRTAATAEYARRVGLGCSYDGVVIPLHDAVQMQVTGKCLEALMAALEQAQWDGGFGWRTADDDRYPLSTPTAMLAFGVAIAAYLTGLVVRYGAIHDEIEAAESHAELDEVDIPAGWPDTGYPGA